MNAILNITIQLLPTGNTESGIDFYIDDVSAAGSTFGFESGDLTGWSTDGDGTYDTEVADTESI
jgi:hypothetical protein